MIAARVPVRLAAALAVLSAAVALIVLAHWPGRVDSDSVATLEQVHDGFVSDQRSAVLTWVWRQAYLAAGIGPGDVLAVQVVVLALALYMLLRAAFRPLGASVLAAAILFAPPTFGFIGLVGRDAWFVSATLLAAGCCVAAVRWAGWWRRAAIALGVVAAFAAVAARQNGFTAEVPLLFGLALVSLPRLGARGRWRRLVQAHRIAAALGVAVLVTAAFVAADSGLTDAVRDGTDYPKTYTELYDLGYLTVRLHERFIPSLPRTMEPVQTVADMRGRWEPDTSIYMRWNPALHFAPDSGPKPFDAPAAKRLDHAWRTAVLHHPLDYLRGRAGLFRRQLGVGYTPLYAMVLATTPSPLGYARPTFPGLSRLAARYANHWGASPGGLTGGPLHHVWPYGLLCLGFLVLLPLSRFPPAVRMSAVLMAAVVGLQVGLFFSAPSVQLRYELLTLYAALVGTCLAGRLAVERLRRRRAATPTRSSPAACS